jgi:hypothetical protein
MAAATAIAAKTYRDSGFGSRILLDSARGTPNRESRASRQSSNGPHNNSTKTAAVISAIDEVMRRKCARASARSDGVITAVTR